MDRPFFPEEREPPRFVPREPGILGWAPERHPLPPGKGGEPGGMERGMSFGVRNGPAPGLLPLPGRAAAPLRHHDHEPPLAALGPYGVHDSRFSPTPHLPPAPQHQERWPPHAEEPMGGHGGSRYMDGLPYEARGAGGSVGGRGPGQRKGGGSSPVAFGGLVDNRGGPERAGYGPDRHHALDEPLAQCPPLKVPRWEHEELIQFEKRLYIESGAWPHART